MRVFITILSAMCIVALSSANSDPEHDHKSHKPYHRDISDHEHGDGDGEHDPRYDHDAFLGKDQAAKFDELSPEESKQRLGEIVDKIDVNNDKKVTPEELREWIYNLGRKTVLSDAKKQFDSLEPKDGKVTFETYSSHTYGKEADRPKDEVEHIKDSLARDERKWKKADEDGDGALSQKEFTDFVHPEEAPRMRDIVIEEAMTDMDKDKDGFVSLDEYLQELYHGYLNDTANKKKLPEWVETERQQFKTKLDADKDGKLSRAEVYQWVVPKDFDNSIKEAKHLIEKADTNKDGVLTKEEILEHHDLFAGSQATDYGSALNRHEEL